MAIISKKFASLMLLVSLLFSWSSITTAAEAPKKLKMAAILAVGPDLAWDDSFLNSWENIRKAKPHGLEISKPVYIQGVYGDSAEAAMRMYARKYDIIWAHSTYSDQVKRIQKKYPEKLFVVVGAGNEGLGGNQFWLYNRSHEAAYVLGAVAGMTTKTNVVSAVGGYAADDVNDVMNAFFAGAKSVNPAVKQKVAFIDSWWNPPAAFEASKAQISAGSDQILMMSDAFEACEGKKAACYGVFRDWYEFAPSAIAGSTLLSWEPHIQWVVDQWYESKVNGTPFNGNTEAKAFFMADDATGVSLGGYDHSPEVKAKVEELVAKIRAGEFEVPLDTSLPASE